MRDGVFVRGEEHLRGLGDGVCEGVEEAVGDHQGGHGTAVEICVIEAGERLQGLRGRHDDEDSIERSRPERGPADGDE